VVITVVSFNSRITAKLVQTVNDKSLSRYWKPKLSAGQRKDLEAYLADYGREIRAKVLAVYPRAES